MEFLICIVLFRHFGKEVVGKLLGNAVSPSDAEKIYLKTYDVNRY